LFRATDGHGVQDAAASEASPIRSWTFVIMFVIFIAPIAFGVPAMLIFIPPPVIGSPAMLAGFG